MQGPGATRQGVHVQSTCFVYAESRCSLHDTLALSTSGCRVMADFAQADDQEDVIPRRDLGGKLTRYSTHTVLRME